MWLSYIVTEKSNRYFRSGFCNGITNHSSDLYLYVIARLCPNDEYHNVVKDDDVRTLAWAQRSPVV